MGFRSSIATVLDRAVGASTGKRLRRAEAAARRRIISVLDVEARERKRLKALKDAELKPTPEQRRIELIERLGQRSLDGTVNQEDLRWATNDPFVPHPLETRTRHQVLGELHRVLQPRTYFEIGVRFGDSLALSRTRTIGVDPAYRIRAELNCEIRTFADTSDDFFVRPDAFDHFGDAPVDLAFIDGMHLSEYALRDFINVEQHCAKGSVVVFDDVLPRNHLEGYRMRRTKSWAGDVYKVLEVLRRLRPDLVLVPLNTAPTGTLIVTNLDPHSTVLQNAWPTLADELTANDPQTVPDDLLNRTVAVDPELVLASEVWPRVVALRDSGAESGFDELWAALAALPRLIEPAEESADESPVDHHQVQGDDQRDDRPVDHP